MKSQPALYLMVGFPGSGKTTAAKILHELTGAEHLWADHERKQRFTHPAYDHAENLQLYAELNKLAEHMLAEGKSVIFDTNFNFYKDREKLRRIALQQGAKAYVVWIVTPRDIAQGRATQDAHKQHTRILGDMSVADFKRMSSNLQPPHDDERTITLDGTTLSTETIQKALAQIAA